MKEIIGFKVFDSEESFVKWQMDEDKVIYSVSPFMFDLKGAMSETNKNDQDKDNIDVNIRPGVGIFITYKYSADQ